MKQSLRPLISTALARFFRVPGSSHLMVDETAIPTLDLLELNRRSPFSQMSLPVFGALARTAVVGENGYMWVSPGVGVALEVDTITITNVTAAALVFRLVALTVAQQTTIGVDSFSQMTRMQDALPQDQQNPWPASAPSVIDIGSHNALIGTSVDRINVPANNSWLIDMRECAPVLYGALPAAQGGQLTAIQGLGIVCETVNTAFHAGFKCREWQFDLLGV